MGIPPAVVPSRLKKVGGEIAYHFRGSSMEAFSRERGPCVALASRECQANPDRDSVYTRVPAEYRIEHSLDASAAVCRSNLFHAKVRLRGEPISSSSRRHLPRQLTMKAREFGMRPSEWYYRPFFCYLGSLIGLGR